MRRLGDILRTGGQRAGLAQGLAAARVVGAANHILAGSLGSQKAGLARAISFHNHYITIACQSAAAAQDVKLQEGEWLGRLKAQFPGPLIHGVRYVIGGGLQDV